MTQLSAVLITKNESSNISDCLKTLTWADEILVLDTGSTDDTLPTAEAMGAKVARLESWEGFGKAKQRAVELAGHDWILSIDADERLSPELIEELIALRKRDFEAKAWHIKRRSYYLGKAIRYCGWQNDAPLRLFNRKFGGFNDLPVHEGIRVSQERATCKSLMHHLTYPTVESHLKKMKLYGALASATRENMFWAALRATHKFVKMYILKLGFLDGYHGYLLCKNSARGIWYKYRQ